MAVTDGAMALRLERALNSLREAREREKQLWAVIREERRLAEAALFELHITLAREDLPHQAGEVASGNFRNRKLNGRFA